MKTKLFFIGTAFALIFMASCDRFRDLQDLTGGWGATKDLTLARTMFDDIYRQVSDEARNNDTIRTATCADVDVQFTTGTTFPAVITITFDSTATCDDLRRRSGQIRATFSGRWRDAGTTVDIELINYYVDGNRVEGTKRITNLGQVNGHTRFQDVVTGGRVIDANGREISYDATVFYDWIAGEPSMLVWEDDIYEITGDGDGLDGDGNAFTMEITSPLRFEAGCLPWRVTRGIIEITPTGYATRSVDFGSGTCDGNVVASVGSYSININIP